MTEHRADEHIASAIAALDLVERPGSWLSLSRNPDGDLVVSGNGRGLARFAHILLRCALDTPESREYRTCGSADRELRDLAAVGSDVQVESISVLETLPPSPGEPKGFRTWLNDRAFLLGCGLVIAIAGVLIVIGLGVVTGFIRTR